MTKLINLGLVSRETQDIRFGESLDGGIIKVSGKCYNARIDKDGFPLNDIDATKTPPLGAC